MGNSSTKSKMHWNDAHYTQVKVCVAPEIAMSFKARCIANKVSMASEISCFMSGETPKPKLLNSSPIAYSTRQKRRKSVVALISQIDDIRNAEQQYLNNIPDNLQTSCIYDAAEQTVSALDEALNILQESY